MKRTVLVLALVAGGCDAPEPQPAVMSSPPNAGFANPELLVTTAWLAEHRLDDDVRVVDARNAEDYGSGHAPGAINLPRAETFDPDGPGATVGSMVRIAGLLGERGIGESHHVVVYDAGMSTAAARVFWTLEHYGHRRVSVLDGGWDKWTAESRETSTEPVDRAAVSFVGRRRSGALSTREMVARDLSSDGVALIDARGLDEYLGERVLAERGGHIPGAAHLEWTENFTDSDPPVLKSPFALRAMLERAGVTPDKRVHAY